MEYTIKNINSIDKIELPIKKFYGRDLTSKKEQNSIGKKRKRKKKLHILRKIFVFLLGLFFLFCFLGLGMVKGILDSTPPLESFHFGATAFATHIKDKNGEVIDTLVQAGSNREAVTILEANLNELTEEKRADIDDYIPEILVNAFVAIEDERFWEHDGIDLKSIGRAIMGVINSDSSKGGGSTITQQLIKNKIFIDSTSTEKGFEKYVRKIQEQYIALQYESNNGMTDQKLLGAATSDSDDKEEIQREKLKIKQQIIVDYLNLINLGANTLGVKVAAKRYFGKKLKDLTISEAAVIASITKNPTKNNPITHPDNNKKRQQQVLKNMFNQHYITEEEYKEAINDDVYSRIQNNEVKVENTNKVYTYFTESVIDQLMDDLQKRLGYTETLARNLLYSGGLEVMTTMDPTIQAVVDAEINNDSNYKVKKYAIDYRLSIRHSDDTQTHYSQVDVQNYHINTLKNKKYDGLFATKEVADQYINSFKDSVLKDGDSIAGETLNYHLEPQCSFVMINQNTGEVVALSGGRGEKTVSRSLNRATNSRRQPGSTFKVISSFAPALELYNKTLATTYYDSEYVYKNKTFKNWYSKGYLGFQNIRAGIVYSLNIIAVRCLMETVTPEVGIKFAKSLGISSLDDVNDAAPALALGGLTYGVTNMELTNAFATIANGGTYQAPKLYTKVYNHDGKLILDNTTQTTTKVLSKENAYLLTSAMADSMVGGKAFSSSYMNVTPTSTRAKFKGQDLAGKSGTTTNNNDVWFVGYSPYYTAGIWGGCDENQSLYDSKAKINNGGTSFHKDIWKKIMQTVHSSLKTAEFEKPASLVTRKVCRKSGLIANVGCSLDLRGDCTYSEYFMDGTQPRKKCDMHNADGTFNMPNKYKDVVSDDTLYIKPTVDVVPIITETDTSVTTNDSISPVIVSPR